MADPIHRSMSQLQHDYDKPSPSTMVDADAMVQVPRLHLILSVSPSSI
jgi:hypothetical protein